MWEPNLGEASVRYLMDTIYTRDVFMHRVDIARATNRPVPPADADADLVADVVRDWARRSGADVTLELLGPAGGTFVANSGAVRVVADAFEFCRLMSGRRGQVLHVEGHGADAGAPIGYEEDARSRRRPPTQGSGHGRRSWNGDSARRAARSPGA